MKAINIDEEKYPPRNLQWFINDCKEEGLRAKRRRGQRRVNRKLVELYAAYDEQCQREGVVDFAELLLRSYELLSQPRAAARALPGALPAHPGRRVPGHQPAAVRVAQAARRARQNASVRGRRRRPVDLRVPRRQRRQHGGLRARLPHRERDQARAELPLARPHPRRRQRADPPQPPAPRQEAVDRRRQGRAGAHLRGRLRRSTRPRWLVEEVKGLDRGGHGARARSPCCTARTRSRACSSTRSSTPALPYRVYGGLRFFERAEIKHALAYLRLIENPTTTPRSCASSTSRRAASARARSSSCRTRRARPARACTRAVSNLVGQGRRQARRRSSSSSTACASRPPNLPLPEIVDAVLERERTDRALPDREGRPGPAREPRTSWSTPRPRS